MHTASLQLGKAFGNGKAKAASFRITGAVPADKPFRQFIGIDGKFGGGNILQLNFYNFPFSSAFPGDSFPGKQFPFLCQAHIHSGALHRILDDVGIQVVKDSIGFLTVQGENDPFFRETEPEIQAGSTDSVLLFQIRLPEQIADIHVNNMKSNRPAARLTDFKQVLDQNLQTVGLLLQNREIFRLLFRGNTGLLQQIDIGDDGRQRRFQVVGDIGDQFGFHPLASDFFLHSALKIRLDPAQLGFIAFKDAEILRERRIQIALRNGAGRAQQLPVFLLNSHHIFFQDKVYDHRVDDQAQDPGKPEAADQHQDEEIDAKHLQDNPVRIRPDVIADQIRIKIPAGFFDPAVNPVPVFADEASLLQTASTDTCQTGTDQEGGGKKRCEEQKKGGSIQRNPEELSIASHSGTDALEENPVLIFSGETDHRIDGIPHKHDHKYGGGLDIKTAGTSFFRSGF